MLIFLKGNTIQIGVRLLSLMCILIIAGCSFGPQKPDRPNKELAFPEPPEQPRFFFEHIIFSSADVIKETEDEEMQRWLTGGARIGETMSKPFGIAVHEGRVFVSDSAKRMVKVYDKPASKYFEIGLETPGELALPMGLATDNNGNLYVADISLKKAMIFTRDGQFIKSIGSPDDFDRLSSIAVSKDGSKVYIVDTGGVTSQRHHVKVYNAHTGEHLFDIGKRGKENGEFNLPKEATIGPDGNLYVVDSGNFRVQVFDGNTGEFKMTFGDIGRRRGQFSRPKGVAVDSQNNIYVTDAAFGNFQIFNSLGQLLMHIGERSTNFEPAKYMLPAAIAIDSDDRIFMVDQYFNRVDVYRPAGLADTDGFFGKDLDTTK